ncbi:nose resistant to fluoxetine protein 6-like [Cloeon dipterum]|uniref:nose resistant to fluoxetine protein 6-like n=1 Tax=Cloeon dipterum TaxID=197152 RepID=UPI00321FB90E
MSCVTFLLVAILLLVSPAFSFHFNAHLHPDLLGSDNDFCREQLEHIIEGISNLDLWALKFIDSSSKPQSGILSGNTVDYGSFDECVGISASVPLLGENIKGKYCLANIHIEPDKPGKMEKDGILNIITSNRRHIELTKNQTTKNTMIPVVLPSFALFRSAFCIPSACRSVDLERILNSTLSHFGKSIGLTIYNEAFEENCSVETEISWNSSDIAFLIMLGALVSLALAATVYEERFNVEGGGIFQAVVQSFSLSDNWRKLTSCNTTMASLDGVRALSIFAVMLCHTGLTNLTLPYINKKDIFDASRRIEYLPYYLTGLSVDSFLLLGGALRTYNMIEKLERKKFFYFKDVIQRYLRLTPALAVIIAFYATIFPLLGSGPTWFKDVGVHMEVCKENWPLNLLYVNNIIDSDRLCIVQTWYLGADMQLYLLAPLIVYPIWMWPSAGKYIILVMLTLSSLLSAYIIFEADTTVLFISTFEDEKLASYVKWIHYFTPSRLYSYLAGVTLGKILSNIKNGKAEKISKEVIYSGSTLSSLALSTIAYWAFQYISPDYKYSLGQSILLGVLIKIVITFCISWIIFVCETGNGGLINRFLSCRPLQFISKLSFCMFLTHYIVISHSCGSTRQPEYFCFFRLSYVVIGHSVYTIFLSIPLHLLVEAPSRALTNYIMTK